MLRKCINTMGNNDQIAQLNAAETTTQTLWDLGPIAQSDRDDQASHSVKAFMRVSIGSST